MSSTERWRDGQAGKGAEGGSQGGMGGEKWRANGGGTEHFLSQNRARTGTLNEKEFFFRRWPQIPTFLWQFCLWRRWVLGWLRWPWRGLWARVFSPAKPNAIKNAIYECGLESKGDAWMQFRSAYYLYAIIFLIFDVEAVFLLPFAVAFTGLGAAACAAMLVFVLMLIEGLAWAWAKGVLTWA